MALALACALIWGCVGAPARAQTRTPGQPNVAAGRGATCIVAPRPNSLWSLAQCCSQDLRSNPGCRDYDAADQYIILKDNSRRKPAAYLIIPTIRVTGIEDEQIFAPPVVDFWKYGWQQARRLVNRPAVDTALAINSMRGRTQNQLHIHIACVLPSVAQRLAGAAKTIGNDPAKAERIALGPADHIYRVIKVSGLGGADSPFDLAAELPGAKADMGAQSIAVVGSPASGAYYVLDTTAEGSNPGAAEELLDQTCKG